MIKKLKKIAILLFGILSLGILGGSIIADEFIKFGKLEMYAFTFIWILISCFVIIMPMIVKEIIYHRKRKAVCEGTMKDEFKNLFDELKNKSIKKLNISRISILIVLSFLYIFIYLLFASAIITRIYSFSNSELEEIINISSIMEFVKYISLILVLAFYLMQRFMISKYNKSYYENVIKTFFTLVNKKIEFSKKIEKNDSKFLEKEYKMANFDQEDFNRYYNSEKISGFIYDKCFMKMSNVKAKKVIKKDGKTEIAEIFNGVFICIDSKNINTYINITLNGFVPFILKDYKIEMDSIEFEKIYDVFSKDKILTMRFLTSDVMEMLIDYYNKYDIKFEISYRNDKIYFRFPNSEILKPELFGGVVDVKLLYKYYLSMKFVEKYLEKTKDIEP